MKLVIHAEVVGEDSVQIYEGTDLQEAVDFMDELGEVTNIQCDLSNVVNGESRALVRKAKGEQAQALISDIKDWLAEQE